MNIPPAATLKICSDSAVNLFDSFYKKVFFLPVLFFLQAGQSRLIGCVVVAHSEDLAGSVVHPGSWTSSMPPPQSCPPHIPDKFKRI